MILLFSLRICIQHTKSQNVPVPLLLRAVSQHLQPSASSHLKQNCENTIIILLLPWQKNIPFQKLICTSQNRLKVFILCDIITRSDTHISNFKKTTKQGDWRILEVFCSVMQHLLARKAVPAAPGVGVLAGCVQMHENAHTYTKWKTKIMVSEQKLILFIWKISDAQNQASHLQWIQVLKKNEVSIPLVLCWV